VRRFLQHHEMSVRHDAKSCLFVRRRDVGHADD
jgi:hypothetical protein